MLFAHLSDLCRRRDDKNIVAASDFLTEAEQRSAEIVLSHTDHLFFGGFRDAERKIAVFLPDYFSEDSLYESPSICSVAFVNISLSAYDIENGGAIGNRDVLGSLMGFGIKRESVGDIAAEGGKATVAVKEKISGLIVSELRKIGRFNVSVSVSDKPEIAVTRRYIEKRITVASPRLDGIVAGVFDISREKAADCVRLGLVSVNGSVIQKNDVQLASDDTVSLRGRGKARITLTGDTSRKGRMIVIAMLYA